MKRLSYRILYLLTIVALMGATTLSCTQAELIEPQVKSPTAFEYVGNPTEAYLDLTVDGLVVSSQTKGNGPVDDNENERMVYNLWVFQYDASSEKLVSDPFYVKYIEIDENNQPILRNIPVTLSDNDGNECIVYVVTNTGDPNWVTYDSGSQNYTGFEDITTLEEQLIPSPDPIFASDENWSIPMNGSSVEVKIEDGVVVKVPVRRMYAKLMINIALNLADATLYNIDIGNIPWYCEVGSLSDGDEEVAAEYPSGTQFISRSFLPVDDDNTDEYPYVMYVPENIHGVVEGAESKTTDNAPSNSLVVNVDVSVSDSQGGTSIYPYSFYPGGNTTDNFNIKRNCVYYINIAINELSETWLPSANCFAVAAGETLVFWPYYRIETGGNYDFTNYLNPEDETEEKTISYVKIIWQTANCIGNNDPEQGGTQLVWTHDDSALEKYKKIYVKTNAEGNALIGAYNKNDEILWSWHIWVTNNDPTNVANGIYYYTYDWDSNGIKGYMDDEGNLTGYSRIPGRTVMPCDLGALAFEPTSRDDTRTFGMLYQWGRKDPFPPLQNIMYINDHTPDENYETGTFANDPVDITKQDYTEETTQILYDNAHIADVGMTAGYRSDTPGDKTPVFYSIAGDDVSTLDNPVLYTVRNPTVYLCGTNEARYGLEDNDDYNYVNTPSNYHSNGDWDDISDDCLWGGINYYNAEKSIVVDKEHSITLYDDYGPDKTIFDPCPFGWRVSPPDLWLGFTKTGMNPTSLDDVNWDVDNSVKYNGMSLYMTDWRSGVTSFFPTQGPRTPDGCGIRVGVCGNFHNATVGDNNRVNILHVHDSRQSSFAFYIFEWSNYMYYVKSCGAQVRCVRESE